MTSERHSRTINNTSRVLRAKTERYLFYCNILNAYKSVSTPSLGRSDRNMVHLLPRYRSVVQRDPPVTKTVRDWSKESVNVLKGCFDCTEWGVFVGSSDDVCELFDVVSEYVL